MNCNFWEKLGKQYEKAKNKKPRYRIYLFGDREAIAIFTPSTSETRSLYDEDMNYIGIIVRIS